MACGLKYRIYREAADMVVALILSGGTGSRLGSDIPKQYIEICHRPIISYCIERLSDHEGIDIIQVVAAEQWQEMILRCFEKYDVPKCNGRRKFHGFSEPGENRQHSIYNGLLDIRKYSAESDTVLIHDAARPLVSEQVITDCIRAVKGHDGVLPVLPMKDTVYKSIDGKRISALLDRSEIYAGQAPEAFRIGPYYEANKSLFPDKLRLINGSTEPAFMAGLDIVMIPGDEGNFKITTKEDMEHFSELLNKNLSAAVNNSIDKE